MSMNDEIAIILPLRTNISAQLPTQDLEIIRDLNTTTPVSFVRHCSVKDLEYIRNLPIERLMISSAMIEEIPANGKPKKYMDHRRFKQSYQFRSVETLSRSFILLETFVELNTLNMMLLRNIQMK